MSWLLPEDCSLCVRIGESFEGRSAGQHFVQDYPKAEDVGAVISGETTHLLWRHVTNGAEHDAGQGMSLIYGNGLVTGICVRGFEQFGQAKIENFDVTITRDEDVLRLEIAMDDTFSVRRCQAAYDLQCIV